MILRLVNGAEESDFLLFVTTSGVSINHLLGNFMKDRDLSLLTLDPINSECELKKSPLIAPEKVTVVDIGDILGWEIDNKVPEYLNGSIISRISDTKRGPKLLDCLTELLVLLPELEVAGFLSKLKKQATVQNKVLAVLHADCVREVLVEAIAQTATTVVRVENFKEREQLVSVRHRKPGGKSVTSKEIVCQDLTSGQLKVRAYKSCAERTEDHDDDEAINKLTTFSLTTKKESEQEAKEKLVLPFYTEEQKAISTVEKSQGEVKIRTESKGAIYYEPDSGDDWDDDDPDDDLDF